MSNSSARTSATDPLLIATISLGAKHGKLGLTICPGKQGESIYGAPWQRDLGADLVAIKAWGGHAVITLMEQHEMDNDQLPDLGASVKALGMDWYHLPIVDEFIPDQTFSDRWLSAGVRIREQLRSGRNILIHCRGGLGRTGLVAAKLLIELGWGVEDAISTVRDVRPGAIENQPQELYVREQQAVSANSDRQTSRVLGCLMGGAIGDALGYQVEFDLIDEIHRKFGLSGVQLPIQGEAIVSDDTQMTLFTLEGLIKSKGQSVAAITESIRRAYLDWYQTQQRKPVDLEILHGKLAAEKKLQVQRHPGNTCMNALKEDVQGTPDSAIKDSKGCGTVMRVAPIGFFHAHLDEHDTFEIGVRSSALTHGHQTAQLAGGAMALLIRKLMIGTQLLASINQLCRYFVSNFMTSLSKIDSCTRQLIPFAPTVLRPSRLRMTSFINELVTLRHDYHNDSTATIAAAASSSSLAIAHNYESADGVAYRGLTAPAPLSMAVSECADCSWKAGRPRGNDQSNQNGDGTCPTAGFASRTGDKPDLGRSCLKK